MSEQVRLSEKSACAENLDFNGRRGPKPPMSTSFDQHVRSIIETWSSIPTTDDAANGVVSRQRISSISTPVGRQWTRPHANRRIPSLEAYLQC